MRVACDTNILVRSAVQPNGPARAVLELVTAPPHTLVTSEFILAELQRALGYRRIRDRYVITDDEVTEFVDLLRRIADVVTFTADVPPLSTDPEDDAVIATSVAGRADVLSTLDRHFRQPLVRGYCATYSLRVFSDVELLAELRAAP